MRGEGNTYGRFPVKAEVGRAGDAQFNLGKETEHIPRVVFVGIVYPFHRSHLKVVVMELSAHAEPLHNRVIVIQGKDRTRRDRGLGLVQGIQVCAVVNVHIVSQKLGIETAQEQIEFVRVVLRRGCAAQKRQGRKDNQ